MIMWNCVEDRVGGDKFGGRVIRRIIFDDIYADRIAVLSQNPISRAAYPHLKSGDKIVFYDNTEIREGNFLLSSEQKSTYLNPKAIIGEVLSTEEEIRNFCKSHGIAKHTQSLHMMVIEAYLFLERKINSAREHNLPDNTGSSRMSRKRPAPVMNEQLAQAKASRILNAMGFPNPAANLISSIAQQQNVNIPSSESSSAMAPNMVQFQQPLAISEIQTESNVEKENKPEKDASKAESNQNAVDVIQPESPRNAQNSSSYGDDVPLSSNTEITEADVKIEAMDPSGVAVVEMENDESDDDEKHESIQMPGPSNTAFQNSNHHQNPHSGYPFPNHIMNPSLPDQLSRNAFPSTSENDSANPWALMQMSGLSLQKDLHQLANRTPPKKLCPKSYTTKLNDNQRIDIIKIFELQKTTKAHLGRMYGVSDVSIHKVIKNKTKWILRAMGKLNAADPNTAADRQILERLLQQAMEQKQAELEAQQNQPFGPVNNPRLARENSNNLAITNRPTVSSTEQEGTSLNLEMNFGESPYFQHQSFQMHSSYNPPGFATVGKQESAQNSIGLMKIEPLDANMPN